MARRGRDSQIGSDPRPGRRGAGGPSPSGGRPAKRELAPGAPAGSHSDPGAGRPPERRQRAAAPAAVAGGPEAGRRAAFVNLGLGGLRPAAFPRPRGARQNRGLRGHRRLPCGSDTGPEARAPPAARAGPVQSLRWDGGALGKTRHRWRAGPGGAVGEKRKKAGSEEAGRGLRGAGGGGRGPGAGASAPLGEASLLFRPLPPPPPPALPRAERKAPAPRAQISRPGARAPAQKAPPRVLAAGPSAAAAASERRREAQPETGALRGFLPAPRLGSALRSAPRQTP